MAMSRQDWMRFETLVRASASQAPTPAQARGMVVTRLLDASGIATPPQASLDWMDWERQKAIRLLRPTITT